MTLSPPPVTLSAEDDALLDLVQRQSLRFFDEGGHPVSGLARDRSFIDRDPANDLVCAGGSGFGAMAFVVAVERGWIARGAAVERLSAMVETLGRAACHHGMLPHFLDGRTGDTIPFSPQDNGGDVVETALALQGFLCARAYFNGEDAKERALAEAITALYAAAEWDFYTQGREVLYWHWSPTSGWALNHEIRGWNECLIAYVLAAGSPTHPIKPAVYHQGFAAGRDFRNGRVFEGIELPLGPEGGGPLFFTQYSFCGLDPRGLADRYADYWEQNRRHTLINYRYCQRNPLGHKGYGAACWGLTASDDPDGYAAHAPTNDTGVISPTAALSAFPYAPNEAMAALRHFSGPLRDQLWGRFGFVDAFCPSRDWTAETFLAIDQGPVVAMIENFRSGLLWRLFMAIPEVRAGLQALDFRLPPSPAART
ncbi:glucoamylase family protein [Rhodospirillum rubrum]|uniref:Glycoamylase-like domain-containing protein n=2 Tax=Rhodospirillum rubrum TaxID=1085 RepID=Q2RP49_RHORT|nr:glucoamylase family protein [Rhodospirillum rubrum]ABC24096.1 conserved hypothetical protein [Rhodospirillum rubrum ATCC 11170]MBK5955781.1 beta-glucosidase [Rhodospirillum rubrum]QXG80038.1 beta-glucosidase [Rhodospirillum rubrum]HAP99707.1 beta-glucosidase [Rhodospirillum rubrum]